MYFHIGMFLNISKFVQSKEAIALGYVGLSGPFTTDQLGLAAENYSAVVSGTAVARATNNMRYISSFCIPQIGEDMA